MSRWKATYRAIKQDLPKATVSSFVKSYLYSASFRVLLNHRLGRFFAGSSFFLFRQLAQRYRYRLTAVRSCDIAYNAQVGHRLRLPHPIGIVIGDGTVIKDRVTIFQQVTFGSHGRKQSGKNYPVVEEDVVIYAGAKIIGGVTIGKGAIIAANAVVNIDVPPDSIAAGVPCRIIKKSS